ncbi:Zinc finger protein [Plakobranchus ocellatus]|uniref:Zinc finger protein n=1 Tax=Plakobranchus ocellatus TaxID=259542 RepID=A0AAV3Z7H4_9GAST|nr:Zinc finger protein [Plakobranchus ocellatus]
MDYVDDLLAHAPTLEDHVSFLSEPFRRLQWASIIVRPKKCVLRAKNINFLSHQFGEWAIDLQDKNIEKVPAAPMLKSKKEARVFLGLVGYYQELICRQVRASFPCGTRQ